MSFELICGDVLQVLPALSADSVHCVVTSPPYWGLRDYKIEPSVWGGEADCGHRWGDEHRRTSKTRNGSIGKHSSPDGRDAGAGQFCQRCHAWRGALGLEPSIELYVEHTVQVFREVRRVLRPEGTVWLNLGDCYGSGTRSDRDYSPNTKHGYWNNPAINLRNPSPAKQLLMIPERVVLALQADGWWVRSRIPWVKHNGMPESVDDRPTSMVEYLFLLAKSKDAYYDQEAGRIVSNPATHPGASGMSGGRQRAALKADTRYVGMIGPKDHNTRTSRHAAYQPSSRARRNSDWLFSSLEDYTRDFQGILLDEAGDPLALVVNPQPFSVEMCEACETCYAKPEYKQLQAVLTCESCKQTWDESGPKLSRHCPACGSKDVQHVRVCACGARSWVSHFATFPERIVSPCILLGTSEAGCCAVCGAPHERIVEKPNNGDLHPRQDLKAAGIHRLAHTERSRVQVKGTREGEQFSQTRIAKARENLREETGKHDDYFPVPTTLGWRPSCSHPLFPAEDPVPCTVLDPFAGSGRAGLAAVKLGRNFVGIEANPKYAAMARWQAEKLTPAAQEAAAPVEVAGG